MADFSQTLLGRPVAKNARALERIGIAKRRIQSILDRETVSHQKTLEQKISEQGPTPLRVDPHLIGLALLDLLELNRLAIHYHAATGTKPWYANPGTSAAAVAKRLTTLAPLYASVSGHGFGNLTGDALELVVFKCLDQIYEANARYAYQGYFRLNEPKVGGRYRKTQPPKHIGHYSTAKEADFLQFGHNPGPLCVECKNYREWIYPHHEIIKELIIKATELRAIPLLVARRLHYTTIANFLEPAGIIAHETYYQYFPADRSDLAAKVKDKGSLGFTDVTASEEPNARTKTFFQNNLPKVIDRMAKNWTANKDALLGYALGEINLAQLYTAIKSPAGGKWVEPSTGGDQPE
jgi:hypothetical protein